MTIADSGTVEPNQQGAIPLIEAPAVCSSVGQTRPLLVPRTAYAETAARTSGKHTEGTLSARRLVS